MRGFNFGILKSVVANNAIHRKRKYDVSAAVRVPRLIDVLLHFKPYMPIRADPMEKIECRIISKDFSLPVYHII